VANADGLGALTTRRIADELGVRPMSLYTHFRDKDAILQAVATELYGRFETPAASECATTSEGGGPDIDSLRTIMRAYFRLLIDNPVLLELDSLIHNNPPELRFAEVAYGCLFRLGIDHRTAIGLLSTLARFVIGCASVYPTRREWDYDHGYWERFRQRLAALPPDANPFMRTLSEDFPVFTQQEAFEFGLEKLLATVAEAAAGA
jgi:AcrR family transcriptional regulator